MRGYKFDFVCPICKNGHLGSYRRHYLECNNRKCGALVLSNLLKKQCCHKRCKKDTVGICQVARDSWESRCEIHQDSTAVPVTYHRPRHKALSRAAEQRLKFQPKGNKERVVRKGEFSGQHIKHGKRK